MKQTKIIIFMLIISCFSVLAFPTGDLIAYWDMESNTAPKDIVTGIYNGTVRGTLSSVTGIRGNAINGSNSGVNKIVIKEIMSNVKPSQDGYSLGCWIKEYRTSVAYESISFGVDSDKNNGIRWRGDAGGSTLFQHGDSGSQLISVEWNPTDSDFFNKWWFLVQVWNGTNVLVYINSTLTATSGEITTFGIVNDCLNSTFFARCKDDTEPYTGTLDECFFFNRTLSQAELTSLYNNGLGDFYNSSFPTGFPTGKLIAYWDMENNTAPRDIATGIYNGTAKGALSQITGIRGNAINGTGISGREITIPNIIANTKAAADSGYTLGVWIQGGFSSNFQEPIGWGGDGGDSKGIRWEFATLLLNMQHGNGSLKTYQWTPPVSMTPAGNSSTWHFLVQSWNGTHVNWYWNSTLVQSTASTSLTPSTECTGNLTFFDRCSDDSENFNGGLDEIFFFNRSLSQDEISIIWNNGLGTFFDEPTTDSCTAPTINNDWTIDSADNCNIDSQSIDLGTGKILFTGNGTINFDSSNVTLTGFQRSAGDTGTDTSINLYSSIITTEV